MFNLPRLGILVGALFAATLPAGAQELPEGSGKEAVAATCNTCHPLLARAWDPAIRSMAGMR